MLDRLLANNIASVQGRFRFDQKDVDLVFRPWHVFDSTGNDNEFSGADSNIAVAQPYEQLTLRHEEQLVLIFVMMPNELAFELCQLDVGVVQLGGDLWSPVVAEQIEFLLDIPHGASMFRFRITASTIGGPSEPEQVAQNLPKATWQVRWTEEASGLDGSPLATTHWEAALDAAIISETSDSSMLENPLGFYVTQLNWTEQRS
jgi:hypothetical protein